VKAVKVAASQDGYVFVVHESNQVFVFDDLGRFIVSFDVGWRPTCICVDNERHRIYVGSNNDAVQVWAF
jgi:hypothetical protein